MVFVFCLIGVAPNNVTQRNKLVSEVGLFFLSFTLLNHVRLQQTRNPVTDIPLQRSSAHGRIRRR